MKAEIITLCLVLIMLLCGCNNKQSPEKLNQTNTTVSQDENSGLPFDTDGIYYKDQLQKSLDETDVGNIYWDYNSDSYSIQPRGNFRTCIIMLAKEPYNEKLVDYWDTTLEYIASLSEIYPCSICITNPINSGSYLAVISEGEIGYSAF